MILYIILIFVATISLGTYLSYVGIRFKQGSGKLGLGHAALGVLALLLLVIHIIRAPVSVMLYNDALILFLFALIGGIVLLALREGRRAPPMLVVVLHAVMAGIGLWLLLLGFIRS